MRIGKNGNFTEPMTASEIRAAKLLPYEILERYGYETNRYGTPSYSSVSELPQQVQEEFRAAQEAYDESVKAGTAVRDYPRLHGASPAEDLVQLAGLTIHEYQL